MGNRDGIFSAVMHYGLNETIKFDGGYFSFAYGNEIALVLHKYNKANPYWILNCDEKLWNEVKQKVSETTNTKELIQFWLAKSKEYEVSDWSNDFAELERIIYEQEKS